MMEEFINDTNYLDQHFLIDKAIINDIIDESNLSVKEKVVEVGPGKCVLSNIIAKRSKHLTCIELDPTLEPYLNVLKDKHKNVDIIMGNALEVYIPPCDKIISALPYSITEPFIEKLIKCDFKEAILIVGKKFADSVVNEKITKLSLLTNSFFKVEKIMDIAPDAFNPMPRVMSSMIRLIPVKKERLNYSYKKFIFRELFFYRYRKLKNNLMEAMIEFVKLHGKQLTKKESKAIIASYNIPEEILNKKIENLSNEEFELIYNVLN